jgi:hypothetical protein
MQEHSALFDQDGCNTVWIFSVLAFALVFVQVVTGGGKDQRGDIGLAGMMMLASSVALAVWGASLWVSMDDVCTRHPSLLLLFHVSVAVLVAQSILLALLIVCGAAFLGYMMGIGGASGAGEGGDGQGAAATAAVPASSAAGYGSIG